MIDIRKEVESEIRHRAWGIAWKIVQYFKEVDFDCIIAGGCLGKKINDVDIFRINSTAPELPEPKGFDVQLVSVTKNAKTYTTSVYPIQLCNYAKDGLKTLVEAFDYAHIQAGSRVAFASGIPEVTEIFLTDAFIVARACASSWFIGSEYPLSSVIRAGKYFASGDISRSSFIRCSLDSMTSLINRGFNGYEDFKDQLDAVDLGLVPDEMEDVSRSSLMELFKRLDKTGGAQ